MRAVDPNLFADGIDRPHLVVHDVRSDNGYLAIVLLVGRHKTAAVVDVDVVDGRHTPGPTTDTRVGTGMAVVDHFAGGAGHGPGADAVLTLRRDFAVILELEVFALLVFVVLRIAEDDRGLLGRGKDIRAIAVNLGGDKSVRTIDQRDDHDHRSHADHDPHQGEDRAELVGP